MQTYEEQKAFIAKLNVIDDVFFQKMAEDKEVCEEILRIILEKPDLIVVEAQAQRFLRNMGAHSVILDLLCQDKTGAYFNIEVQKSDDDDHQKRIRFNRSNIDTAFVEKGLEYSALPDVYMVFISKFDPFQQNRTIYHINRVIEETGTVVENGVHEVYVNTAVNDGTDISELMQFFKRSVGEHQKFQKLSARVKYFKESQKGVSEMCQLVEEYAEEKAKKAVNEAELKAAMNLLKKGVPVNLIAESFSSLPVELLKALQKQLV